MSYNAPNFSGRKFTAAPKGNLTHFRAVLRFDRDPSIQ